MATSTTAAVFTLSSKFPDEQRGNNSKATDDGVNISEHVNDAPGEAIHIANKKRWSTSILQCLVIFGVLHTQVVCGFVFHSVNIVYVELIDLYGISRTEASIMPSVFLSLAAALCIPSGYIIRKAGMGLAMTVGAVVACVGCLAASFAPNYQTLVGCTGVVAGFGHSILYMGCYNAPPDIVSARRRSTLTSIITFASGFGQTTGSLAIKYLIDKYTYRGCMIIVGGLYFQSCTTAVCLWAFYKRRKLKTNSKQRESWFALLRVLLKNPTFILLVIAELLSLPFVLSLVVVFVDHIEGLGFTRQTAVFFVSMYGLAGLGGRFGNGFLHHIKRWHGIFHLSGILLLQGMCLTAIPFLTAYTSLLSVIIVLGLVSGPILAYTYNVLYEIVTIETYPVASSIHATLRGIMLIVSTPLCGWIRDTTGSYNLFLYFGLPLCGFSALMLSTHRVITQCSKRNSFGINC